MRAFTLLLIFCLAACGPEQSLEPDAQKKHSALDVFDPTPPPSLPKAWVYGITPNGSLRCYRHNAHLAGQPSWDFGAEVGHGFSVHQVFAGGGAVYVIYSNGDLWWFKHTGYDDCSPTWQATHIGWGWNSFNQVVAVGDGVLYAFQTDGKVRWYRHLGFADGAISWAIGSGKFVATLGGPITYQLKVFSPGGGAMYLHRTGADTLSWFRQKNYLTGQLVYRYGPLQDLSRPYYVIGQHYDFEFGAAKDPQFAEFSTEFAGPDGVIYGIKANGDLIWNRFLTFETGLPRQNLFQFVNETAHVYDDPAQWAGPTLVGLGWDAFNTTFARQE